jgi:23S rRNA (uracil1939-C5)-methyltransferase
MAKTPQKPEKSRRPGKRPLLPTIEVDIARLDDDGVAVGRHEGKDVLVAGALPGEKVMAVIERTGESSPAFVRS